ncbi:MAG: sterol desaturase family protein [Tumebacillaceae bacterium]
MDKQLRDFFGHNSIWIITMLILVGLISIIRHLAHGGPWLALLIGAVLFFVSEYTTHRFLFHAKPSSSAFVRKLQDKLHYLHHEDPQELEFLFLPVWYSIPNYAVVWVLTFAITRDVTLATAVTVGALSALLYYEWVHFVAHRPIKPLTPWGKWMKKVHLWHHFKNENYWFGVTNPSMDVVMGTFHNEKSVELSPTARKLHNHQQANF